MIAPGKASSRWYALLAAAPDPEAHERLNVAIVVHDKGRQRLVFDPKLPRLRCLLSTVEADVYAAVLKTFSPVVSDGLPIEELRRMIAPQMVVSDPRGLARRASSDVVEALVQRHLGTVDESNEETQSTQRYMQELNRVLDQTIDAAFPRALGIEVARRALFSRLYPNIRKKRGTRIPSLNRAVRGPRNDLLVGAVLLNGGDPAGTRSKGARIGQAFWEYRRLRGSIRETGRDLRTVGLLIREAPSAASQEIGLYLRHLWARDADGVAITGAAAKPPRELAEAMEWVAQE